MVNGNFYSIFFYVTVLQTQYVFVLFRLLLFFIHTINSHTKKSLLKYIYVYYMTG